ncbi:MAG TPA: hydrophobe/amphiphile efflux-3 (HAE3) family transporter [Methanospirillum sp.]|uniref:efflux RND transporter permease subunit n=1 Tax=Methanospirillum sp. TaxID=45200 RepID=UPI002C50FDA2|nr:hydrophobe/amphiphile efflux-3 (HAE3) family transporter [Methanospirillum sp.]HWQ64671.1 hydrophobe/amphiphile efflux-3 (HAE3) family transporter [Methanospirillum sp.]
MTLLNSFYCGVADLVLKRPAEVLLVMALLFLAALIVIGNLSMESGASIYLSHDDPSMRWYTIYTDKFALEKDVVLYISAPKPLDHALILDLQILKKELLRIPGVEDVQTVSDAILLANQGSIPATNDGIEEAFSRLSKSEQKEIIPDSLHTLGTVVTKGDTQSLLDPIQAVINEAHLPPGVTIEISGSDAFDQQMMTEMTKQIFVLILGAFTLMFIGLFILFGSVRYRLLPLAFVMVGLVYLFGILGAFRVPINIGAIGGFPILLGLGIDYAVQFQARLNDELRVSSLEDAIRTTICNTGSAVLYAMVATMLGFVVLFITPLPILTGFTLTAIIGILCAYGATLFGFPALAILINYQPKDLPTSGKLDLFEKYNQILSKVAEKVARAPVLILVLVLVLAGIGMVIDDQIPIDTTEDSMVPSDMPAKVVMDKVTNLLGSQTPVELVLTGSDLTSLESLQWMERYGAFIQSVYPDKIIGYTSIATLVKEYNGGKLPDTLSQLDEVLSSIPESEKKKYLSEKIIGLMEFQTVSLKAQEMSDIRQVILDNVGWAQPPPGISARTSGMFELNAITLNDIVKFKPLMTNLAFLMILLFLIIAYRHFVSIAPMVPIICVVGWNAVVMWVFSIDYTFITASLGAITIGVSSEYTILMMERYLEERKTTPDLIEAISNSVQKIGASITVSGLVTAFGFSALLLSSFPIISNFGVMTVIAVIFSLVGAIIIMPAILAILGRIEDYFE